MASSVDTEILPSTGRKGGKLGSGNAGHSCSTTKCCEPHFGHNYDYIVILAS